MNTIYLSGMKSVTKFAKEFTDTLLTDEFLGRM